MPEPSAPVLLEVEGLTVGIRTEHGVFNAIDDVSFTLHEGEALGLVGESGCGKSITALALMDLLPQPVAKLSRGRIVFDGIDLTTLHERDRRLLRGDRMGMIFQEPMTSLNPVYRIGDQIVEALRAHRPDGRAEAWREAVRMLDMVGIPGAEQRARAYPHELSGGMRQRVMIAIALICRPRLLIADEPTTALDVSIQAQILELLLSLQRELGMAVLMITHDLGVVAEVVDKVAVMYAGQVVEQADVFTLFREPRHPYTDALLHSIPRLDEDVGRLQAIEGLVAPPHLRPTGCGFRTRCTLGRDRCAREAPALEGAAAASDGPVSDGPASDGPGHRVRCFYPVGEDAGAPDGGAAR